MINFIIYEDNLLWQKYYKKIISKIMMNKKESYHIHEYSKYTESFKKKLTSLTGKKIFLLDLEVPGKSGLDVAKAIRDNGDWQSIIIVITSHESFKEKGFTSKLLMLDFISKKNALEEKINESILLALHIHTQHKSFTFTYNHDFYQIPYEDILYFEKDLYHNYTRIITKDNFYKIKQSIKKLEMEFEKLPLFFKTHQSCIVNLKNIRRIDFNNNIIYFENHKTNLLSRNKKKELKEYMEKGVHYDFI